MWAWTSTTAPNVNNSKIFDYEFDNNGNITGISQGNQVLQKYTYDDAQQLVREDNAILNKSFTYGYDHHGNILNKKTYAFTVGSLGAVTDTKDYAYGNSDWPDMLTGIGNAAIASDEIGNPVSVTELGQPMKTFTWTSGRQLASVQTGSDVVSYTYDLTGMLTSKTVAASSGTETTRYMWTGDQRLAAVLHSNGTVVRVLYGQEKQPFGMTINSQVYLYEKNPQGDIISLINPLDGSEVVCYTYDAFGNMTMQPNPIALLNPLTYRGYLADHDTGMYYLKSRFYEPNWGRFLNADVLFDTGTGILGTNMFAYCCNNPVNKVDVTGMWAMDVHRGDVLMNRKAGTATYNGVVYGTIKWADDLDFTPAQAKILADANQAVDKDMGAIGAAIWKRPYDMSWHINNTYNYINPLMVDTREWRSLGRLIDLYDEDTVLEDLSGNSFDPLFHLGYASHPMQDLPGHGDDYVKYGGLLIGVIFIPSPDYALFVGWTHGWFAEHLRGWFGGDYAYADKVVSVVTKHGIRYYHWDDVFWTRDLTYDMLGRYYYHYLRKK